MSAEPAVATTAASPVIWVRFFRAAIVAWIVLLVLHSLSKQTTTRPPSSTRNGNVVVVPRKSDPASKATPQSSKKGTKKEKLLSSTTDDNNNNTTPPPNFILDYASQPYLRETIQRIPGGVRSYSLQEFIYNTFFSDDSPQRSQERFLIEVGPCEPEKSHTSHMILRRGWSGVVLEPSSYMFPEVLKNFGSDKVKVEQRLMCPPGRTSMTYIQPGSGCGTVEEFTSPLVLTIHKSSRAKFAPMKCVSVADLCLRAKQRGKGKEVVDVFVYDAEGAYDVFRDVDLRNRNIVGGGIGVLAFSHPRHFESLHRHLRKHGYRYGQRVRDYDVYYRPDLVMPRQESPHYPVVA
eukprot:PhM_4_TR8856/c0_g1_i1/m.4775